jgi:hypothetical protein
MITNKKQQQWIAYYSICMEFFVARCGRCNALNAAHNVGFNTFYWVGPLYDGAHPHSVLGGPGPPGPPQDRRHCYSYSKECLRFGQHLLNYSKSADDVMGDTSSDWTTATGAQKFIVSCAWLYSIASSKPTSSRLARRTDKPS